MGTETSKNRAGTLLAAASIIGLSVGMVSAEAADTGNNQGVLIGLSKQDKHAAQLKYESQQKKYMPSNQIKGDSSQLKYQSQQLKLDSAQQKGISTQLKTQHQLNPQPLPPG